MPESFNKRLSDLADKFESASDEEIRERFEKIDISYMPDPVPEPKELSAEELREIAEFHKGGASRLTDRGWRVRYHGASQKATKNGQTVAIATAYAIQRKDDIDSLLSHIARLSRERDELAKENDDLRHAGYELTLHLMDADVMALRIDEAVDRGQIDARSPIADARQDYSEPHEYRCHTKEQILHRLKPV